MSRLDALLGQDERVLFRTRLHPLACCRGAVLVIALAAAGLAALVVAAVMGAMPYAMVGILLAAGLLLAGGVAFGVIRLVVSSHEFAVTPARLLATMGIVRTRTVDVGVAQVETLTIEQGPLGRLLDYGDVRIVGTGGTAEDLAGVRDPGGLRKALSEAADRLRRPGEAPAGGR